MSATAPLLLAIDAGTGSCRAALFTEDGQEEAIRSREWSHAALPGVPGSQVFDTDGNWQLICECVREVLAAVDGGTARVRAVSATSMREGMVCYDARDTAIWACPNVDARAVEEATQLVASGLAEEIFTLGGDWVSITAPARFRWLARHEPRLFESIAQVGMLGDWVLQRLSGIYATDPSLGSSSGMFELSRQDWSSRTIDICELDRSVFPHVTAPGTAIGEVTTHASAQTGLRAGTPVVVGGADTQLGLVGLGTIVPGGVTVVGGSFWQLTAAIPAPQIDGDRRLRTLCHALPGQWMIEGIGFYSGLAMRWFRDAFCAAERDRAQRDGTDVYDLLELDASDVPPGSDGVVGIFSNLMNAARWVHASPAFIGFDLSDPERSGRRQCVRAIEESAAYVACGHLGIVQEVTGLGVDHIVFTGGGAKGRLWPRILADVLGLPVMIPHVKESTALGAAMYAGVGGGLFSDISEIASRVARFERTVEPDAEAHRAYESLYASWRELYTGALGLSEAGLARPLWRAAGT
jgi:autoinducer 2 (AI-2) kinase